ncbi:MAG: hypothetical protein C0490_19445 [Marivirga sp.]|nr:hypothetical protein [Marivirga sp.]
MKALFFLLVCLTVSESVFAQKPSEVLQGTHSLRERYLLMKSKSQSYGEYKVIKETTLDGVWRIMQDSIAAKDKSIVTANNNIKDLKAELNKTIATLKEKEQSMTDILHASTHISVMGMDLAKGAFISMVGIIIAGLLVFLGVVIGRMKLQSKALSERNLAVNALTSEFDEYKHRAMDKQTKLSRELQDERNKLQAMIRNT